MLTRRGWLLAVSSMALAAAGRSLGLLELFVLATGVFALVVMAFVSVLVQRTRFSASRSVHPPKVHAGTESRVDLVICNMAARTSPVVSIRDPFDLGRRQARFLLGPLARREAVRAAYRLPTEHRGVFAIGPLEVTHADAFGLATVTRAIAAQTELTVYPRVDAIAPLPHTRGHDPLAGADHPTALGFAGEDFYALRNYEVGDDLRRVHWPSTARLDELMIRQHEMPWQGRATVLLDNRAAVHNAQSLELAVSAAASIVAACWGRGSLLRLVSTDGLDSGFAAGAAHVEAIMERLAVIERSRSERLAEVLSTLRTAGNAGALAAILTEEVGSHDLEQLAALRTRFGSFTIVSFSRSAYLAGPTREVVRPLPPVGTHVRVTADQPFAEAWSRAVAAPGPAAMTGRRR